MIRLIKSFIKTANLPSISIDAEELKYHIECALDSIRIQSELKPIDSFTFLQVWVLQTVYYIYASASLHWVEEEYGYSIEGISMQTLVQSEKYQSVLDPISKKIDNLIVKGG